MAKGKLPKRTTQPGKGPTAQKKAATGPIVGYGDKGHAFHDQKKYNQSKSGQAHAKNPSLSKKPVGYGKDGNAFFSAAKYEASKAGKSAGGHLGGQSPPPQAHAPMPGHPSQNPTSYHGPSTTGTIKPGAIRAPRMK